jgi:hypothetical protein
MFSLWRIAHLDDRVARLRGASKSAATISPLAVSLEADLWLPDGH